MRIAGEAERGARGRTPRKCPRDIERNAHNFLALC